ncbi:MAG: prepilin-type N-terminal cleavage/methylation domain-containing protein [Pirellulaceae bacterium]
MRTRKLLCCTEPRLRGGFTLVEVLVVIAIIGVVVAMLVPTLGYAIRKSNETALAMEVSAIEVAIIKYRDKYGEYPPDGSSATDMTRHFRKIFPNIASSELTLLTAGSNSSTGITGSVMDPPEALVFFLGGFSDDSVHPFTGAGGPFSATGIPAIPYQYNIERNEPLYEFNSGQLTLTIHDENGTPLTISNDETELGLPTPPGFVGDLIPVYRPSGRNAPFVYFNSRTYATAAGFNRYPGQYPGSIGTARPYKSDAVNTSAGATSGDTFYRYAEPQKFQIISAGLDDIYGGFVTGSDPTVVPMFSRFPSGDSLDITQPLAAQGQSQYDRYGLDGQPINYQLDNITNFSDGTLVDSLP